MEWNWILLLTLVLSVADYCSTGRGLYSSNSRSSSKELVSAGEDDDDETAAAGPQDPEAAAARGRCNFPVRWEGNWFQSGFHQTVAITRHSISSKGKCLEADGDKFIVYNERDACYRCLVFHEKHQNALQYKETFCIPERRSLRNTCLMIGGDANLFSMFRLDAVPIECPFRGPLTFTYNRGHGDCHSPVSTLDSCLHPSRLALNYQACPDVPGTESTEEQLECLASWKEGSSRYLLGLIQYPHPASFEDRFRCFVYEKIRKERTLPSGHHLSPLTHSNNNNNNHHPRSSNNNNGSEVLFRVAMSGDATCNGLTPHEGSRVLTLRKAPVPKACHFPSWLRGDMQWLSLDGLTSFSFDGHELRVRNLTGGEKAPAPAPAGSGASALTLMGVCYNIQDNPGLDRVLAVLHTTTSGCRSGYVCTAVYRRERHIIELQMGAISRRHEDACHPSYFAPHSLPLVTLLSSSPEKRECPYGGHFEMKGLPQEGRHLVGEQCSQDFSSLSVGCSTSETLQLESQCSRARLVADYLCHGWWEEAGIRYLITSSLSRFVPSKSYCFAFQEGASVSGGAGAAAPAPAHNSPDNEGSSSSSSLSEGDNAVDNGRNLLFLRMGDTCRRNLELHHFAFNVSSQGRCRASNDGRNFKAESAILPFIFCFITALSFLYGDL